MKEAYDLLLCIETRGAQLRAKKLNEINWLMKHSDHFYDSDVQFCNSQCCYSDILLRGIYSLKLSMSCSHDFLQAIFFLKST